MVVFPIMFSNIKLMFFSALGMLLICYIGVTFGTNLLYKVIVN